MYNVQNCNSYNNIRLSRVLKTLKLCPYKADITVLQTNLHILQ
jgi:hypothetical protein